ncbi:MAG: glycosyltransferase family 39 protein [Verrucomicrobiota bacterium]
MARPGLKRHPLPLAAAVFLACFLSLLPGLGRPVVSRIQELRVAVTAQHMAGGGSWLVPTFRSEPRLRKPPLEYWIVAAALKLAGDARSALAARLPNALMASLLATALYAGGASLIGRRRALLAAAAGAASALFQRYARVAETDIPLALFTTISMLSLYAALCGRRETHAWLCAGAFAGLGFMAKGLAALAVPLLTLIVFVALTPAARRRLASWRPLTAVLLFLAVAAPWYVLLLILPGVRETTLTAAGHELHTLATEGLHANPWYFYLHRVPLLLIPWGPLLLFALVDAAWRGRRHQNQRFLACWFFVTLVELSLLPNKQDHYILLLLPPAALLLGCYLGHALAHRASFHGRLVRGYAVLLVALATLAVPALLIAPVREPSFPSAGFCVLAAAVAALAWAGWVAVRRRALARSVVIVWAAAALVMPARIFLGDNADRGVSLIPELLRHAEPYVATAPGVYYYGSRKAKDIVDFYLGRESVPIADLSTRLRPLAGGSVVLAAAKKSNIPDLSDCRGEVRFDQTRHSLRCVLITMPGADAEPTSR